MSALTLRLSDHKHERLKAMAEQRGSNRLERGLALFRKAQAQNLGSSA